MFATYLSILVFSLIFLLPVVHCGLSPSDDPNVVELVDGTNVFYEGVVCGKGCETSTTNNSFFVGFGFASEYGAITGSTFPTSVKIRGIEVKIQRDADFPLKEKRGSLVVLDGVVSLAIHHPKKNYTVLIGENRARSDAWPTSGALFTYGGENDTVTFFF